MAEISDIRSLLYDKLFTFADGESPALRIFVKGIDEFKPAGDEVFLRQWLLTATPRHLFAGAVYDSRENGIYQIDVVVPEEYGQKEAEKIAWRVRTHFWPDGIKTGPTLGTDPLLRLGPRPPYVRDHPAPDAGFLASSVDVYWNSDIRN